MMKLTQTVFKQHIGWHFKKIWSEKSARKVIETDAEKILTKKGIKTFKPEEILANEPSTFQKFEIVGHAPPPQRGDATHPDWHDTPLLTYKDNNVLLEGITQAKVLTKTVETDLELPKSLVLKSTKEFDQRVKDIILAAHVFDAEQKILPKIKDPERPAWNFPRVYGITQDRAIKLLLLNMLQFVENTSDKNVVKQRRIFEDCLFSVNFKKIDQPIQFELQAESLLTSVLPLGQISNEDTSKFGLPDMFPISPTIALNPENIYILRNIYPVNLKMSRSHPHTLFIHHNEETVKNLFEEEVTDDQIRGRSLLKTFTAAAAYAKQIYGEDIKELPKPITVQCVQTNSRLFHFGILQLNSLDLEKDDGVKNIWYQTERIPLFDFCGYRTGRPVLEGYNNQVAKYLIAFYNNV